MSENGKTAAFYIVRNGWVDVAEEIWPSIQNVNVETRQQETLLHAAVASESVDMVRLCIERGARMDVSDIFGHTAFSLAFWGMRRNVVSLLIAYGCTRNMVRMWQHQLYRMWHPLGSCP